MKKQSMKSSMKYFSMTYVLCMKYKFVRIWFFFFNCIFI